jgi:hypothetical protein
MYDRASEGNLFEVIDLFGGEDIKIAAIDDGFRSKETDEELVASVEGGRCAFPFGVWDGFAEDAVGEDAR